MKIGVADRRTTIIEFCFIAFCFLLISCIVAPSFHESALSIKRELRVNTEFQVYHIQIIHRMSSIESVFRPPSNSMRLIEKIAHNRGNSNKQRKVHAIKYGPTYKFSVRKIDKYVVIDVNNKQY